MLCALFDDEPIEFFDDCLMAHLLCRAGIFESVGEAKRNGWAVPVSPGWQDIRVGKNRNRLCIMGREMQ